MNKIINKFLSHKNLTARRKFYTTIWAIFIGLVISSLFLASSGSSFLEILNAILFSSFETSRRINHFLFFSAIYIVIGISIVIPLKMGYFNIGVSGKMTFAGIISILILDKYGARIETVLLAFVASFFGAFIIGLVISVLKVYLKINEVVSSIFSNWIFHYLAEQFLGNNTSLINPFNPEKTQKLILPSFLQIENIIIYFLIFSVVLALFAYVVLQKTSLGYKIKAVGKSEQATKYAGIKLEKISVLTFSFNSGIAGIAGFFYFIVLEGGSYNVSSAPIVIGFNGLTVALLAFASPVGTIFASFFYSLLNSHKFINLNQNSISFYAESLINGIIILVICFSTLIAKIRPILFFIKTFLILNKKKTRKKYFSLWWEIWVLKTKILQIFIKKKYVTFFDKNERKITAKKDALLISKLEIDKKTKLEKEQFFVAINEQKKQLEILIKNSKVYQIKNEISKINAEIFQKNYQKKLLKSQVFQQNFLVRKWEK